MNPEPATYSGEAASIGSGSPDVRPDRAIVRVRRVWKTYHSGRFRTAPAVEALRGVSLEAYPGEVFGLLGPNGAGKTTLIKILLGIIRPTAGGGELFGRPLGDSVARMRVGYLPESLRVDLHHTARSALRYYGRLSRLDRRTIDLRSDELLELVGLRDRGRESVRRFSKGMYQRLGLAQALMHDPDLLVLDEPTDGLDPVGRNEVRRVIERLRDLGKTVFLNSHILQEVELVCSRLAVMAGGQIRAVGTLAEITDRKSPQFEIILDGGDHPSLSGVLETALARVEGLQWSVDELPAVRDVRVLLSADPNAEPMTDRSVDRTRGQRLVDQVVDLLRGQGISIRQLQRVEETLEQAFIRLVATEVSATPDLETPGAGPPSDDFDPGASGAPSGPVPEHESSDSLSTENR